MDQQLNILVFLGDSDFNCNKFLSIFKILSYSIIVCEVDCPFLRYFYKGYVKKNQKQKYQKYKKKY